VAERTQRLRVPARPARLPALLCLESALLDSKFECRFLRPPQRSPVARLSVGPRPTHTSPHGWPRSRPAESAGPAHSLLLLLTLQLSKFRKPARRICRRRHCRPVFGAPPEFITRFACRQEGFFDRHPRFLQACILCDCLAGAGSLSDLCTLRRVVVKDRHAGGKSTEGSWKCASEPGGPGVAPRPRGDPISIAHSWRLVKALFHGMHNTHLKGWSDRMGVASASHTRSLRQRRICHGEGRSSRGTIDELLVRRTGFVSYLLPATRRRTQGVP
jgi:hypothetical protein